MIARRCATLLAISALWAGCALTPDHRRPEVEGMGDAWYRSADVRSSIANLEWWEIYRDPTLATLIERALESNQDLAVALARMQEARFLVTFTRAEQFPFLDVFGSASRGRGSKEINPLAETDDVFSIGGRVSFQVDLWRRYARATEAARADLLASEAAYRNVTIGLVAEVASTYLLLRDLDRRLEISERTAEGRRDRASIVRARFEKGIEARIDVYQAETQLAIAEASIEQFRRGVAQTEHALRLLVGELPGPIERGAEIQIGDLSLAVPAGLPSQLLERRPDLVEAEQRLHAETARVGVAQALRFPALSLTADVSAVAKDLTDLNSTDAGEWNVMAGIFQPIFNSGRLKAQKRAQEARAQQALHAYLAAAQRAFREVEDALVEVDTALREHQARVRQVDAARGAATLSRARYDGGVVDYLEVLDSERTLFDAEIQESDARRAAMVAFVTLYQALGGGWNETDPTPEASDPRDVVPSGSAEEAEAADEA